MMCYILNLKQYTQTIPYWLFCHNLVNFVESETTINFKELTELCLKYDATCLVS